MKVLAILGSSRCGSTVLANILGEQDGFFAGGEIRFLWQRALEGRRCGCGQRVDRCDVWRGPLEAGVRGSSVQRVAAAERTALRLWRTPKLLRGRAAAESDPHLHTFLEAARLTYQALAADTGARVVVDSSKRPSYAAGLMLLPDVELSVVHLVRDPRAVAFSRIQPKPNPDRDGGMMPRSSAGNSAVHWLATNMAAELVRRRLGSGRSLLVRYEDLMSHPRVVVDRIVRFAGGEPAEDVFLDERTVRLRPNHTVSGNPDRFLTGSVELRADERWLNRMKWTDRVIVSSMTWPLRRRYRGRRPGVDAGGDR
jgi:hypothetical protein